MSENQNTERTLTEAESKRAELLKEREEKLFAEGYKRHDLTTSVETASTKGLLLPLPIALVIFVVYTALYGFKDIIEIARTNFGLYMLGLLAFMLSWVVLAVVHESIHAFFWSVGTKAGFKEIEFGFIKEKLTPYCTCKVPMSKSRYVIGSIMPATILGLGFGIAGIITGNFLVMIIGAMQVFGGAGDFLITSMLLGYKTKGKDVVIMDHPTEVGLVVYERD